MNGKRALVIGSGGGIGTALVDQLAGSGDFDRIYAGSRRPHASNHHNVTPLMMDILDDDTLAEANREIARDGALDLLIVATGLLHREPDISPEKSLRNINAASMAEAFAVNSIGPALVAKHFLPLLDGKRRAAAIFLSARVGSIEDNRLGGWHSYRASKAALNALMRCLAIEVGRRNPETIIVAMHPGTVNTPLSESFQAGGSFAVILSRRMRLTPYLRDRSTDAGG